MYQITRNHERTLGVCPVLSGAGAYQYLKGGELPAGAHFMPVPPGIVLVERGVWITTEARAHTASTVYLIASDKHDLDLEGGRADVACYYSPRTQTHFIGKVEDGKLVALVADEFPDIDLALVSYAGRVVASV